MRKKFISVLIICLIMPFCFIFTACNKVEFKIDFMVDNEIYETIKTGGNETISMPEEPTKDGFTFDGWYWDNETFKNPFTANSLLDAPLSSDMKVYAKWKDSESLNGTEAKFKDFEKIDDFKYSLTVSNSTDTFSFINAVEIDSSSSWSLSSDIGGQVNIPTKTVNLSTGNNTFYVLVTDKNDNIQLYTLCIRRKAIFTVSFDTLCDNNVHNQYVEEGGIATIPSDVLNKDGYTFERWDYDFTQSITHNVTIVAKWIPNTYLITFDKQGGVGGSDSVEATFDSLIPNATTPTKIGHTFMGYFTEQCGSGIQYYSEEMTALKVLQSTNLDTLYAYWITNTYSIEFISNSGTTIPTITQLFDTSVQKPTNPTLIGHTFDGWYENGSQQEYVFDTIEARDVKLYAKWTPNTYLITFDKQGGVGGSDSVEATFGASMPQAEAPQKEGWTFCGYYYSKNGTGLQYYSSTMESVRPLNLVSLTKLYAHWIPNTYLITFDKQGGVGGSDSVDVQCGASMPQAEAPTKANQLFAGYFTEPNGAGSLIYTASMTSDNKWAISNNTTLYAYWVSPYFTISDTTLTGLTEQGKTQVSITIPNGITTIGEDALWGCENLEKLVLSDSVITIKSGAFGCCSNLNEVSLSVNLITIESASFYACGELVEILIPEKTEVVEGGAFTYCEKLTMINVSSNNNYLTSINGHLYSRDRTKIICYAPGNQQSNISILDTVTEIGDMAFYGCNSIQTVTIPNSVQILGVDSFSSCYSLNTISIGDGVTVIKEGAFSCCFELSTVSMGKNVTEIGFRAFFACNISTISLGEKLEKLGDQAFESCENLVSITIPKTLKLMRDYIFKECYKLTTINFTGTTAQWTAVAELYYWDYQTGNYKVYCSNGTISK